jgi:hypothetical protein
MAVSKDDTDIQESRCRVLVANVQALFLRVKEASLGGLIRFGRPGTLCCTLNLMDEPGGIFVVPARDNFAALVACLQAQNHFVTNIKPPSKDDRA